MKIASITGVLLITCTLLSAQNPIDSAGFLSIGGIRQYITIKGKDRSLPLLLFLHGGPGGSVMPYANKFTHRLQHHFVVIQWDQRETGRTLSANASPLPLTLGQFQEDTYEMVATLLARFGREKLYLVGHSWGTALGFHIAKNHPTLLYAYIPIGSMIDQLESERMALSMLKADAAEEGNAEAIAELDRVRIPFENGEQLYYHRKWLLRHARSRKDLPEHVVVNWAQTWLNVFNEASRDNLFESTPSIECPIYFVAGRKDYQTNSVLAEKYYHTVSAPKKDFFWLERAAHSIPSSEPERLQAIIVETILPATYTVPRAGNVVTHH